MTLNENNQLYRDVTHCIDVLVDTISDEISVAVTDLVLDGKIGLGAYFDRHGMIDDGCERHVFMSSYQRDILKRVERKLSKKGFNCRVQVNEKGKRSYIEYTTRVSHPMKRFFMLSGFVILPLLATVAALRYAMVLRNTSSVGNHIFSRRETSAAVAIPIPNPSWEFYDKGKFPSKAEAESRRRVAAQHRKDTI